MERRIVRFATIRTVKLFLWEAALSLLQSCNTKATESKARRLAARLGWRIAKSRHALSLHNLREYMLYDAQTNFVIVGEHFDWTAEEIVGFCEERLN
jgi:hypothetical protein